MSYLSSPLAQSSIPVHCLQTPVMYQNISWACIIKTSAVYTVYVVLCVYIHVYIVEVLATYLFLYSPDSLEVE